ncbi:MAG: glycosyltransferase family 4 protein [Thermoplasmata archaeon]|nr:MAG: glycosyltransferase family 4 protein [Thermoplasmata archaeon]
MAKKNRVLFIYPFSSTFIKRDLNILKEEFQVISFHYRGKKDIFRLLKNILSSPVNVSWFVLGHATMAVMFSRIFGKRSIIIAGGWDVVYMPEIDYGAMKGKRIKKTRYALKKANKIMAVSESTKEWVSKWIDRDDVITVYHGFNSEKFYPKGKKEDMVLTVGKLADDATIKVKGLETFIKAAGLLPDIKFVLIGKHDLNIAKIWREKAPSNLEIIDFMPEDRLIEYYQKAKVYAQPSFQESFGCALAEAMLCECVPVVTRRGAIPEVVGDVGYYVEYGDAQDTANKIKEALKSHKGSDARKRIATLFPRKERKKNLTKIVYDCLE